ncbi:sporulation-induced protein [Madurella fahalii]|uniref:Sporulation-induced protein n=1 Tax=Madurella fahalii TaxID=1157608 RepID=A0ABQ0GK40_9PEZI
MFWRFGGLASASTIDTILEKDNFQLEELLDEGDLVQELKQHNAKLVEYLREPQVLEQLLKYVVAPKLEPVATADDDEDEEDEKGKGLALPFTRSRSSSRATDPGSQEDSEKKRNRYAFVAAEILSSDNWSMYEALMESKDLLGDFWQFLKRPAPLDPLQASYFTKVNESLFDKKTEEMLQFLKSLDGAVADILRHVDCPMIMDLLLKIISLERTEAGQGIVEWLYTQDVMPTLVSFLGPSHSWSTQTSAADFIKAIITVSANASQNEQTCIGPNELTRQLVSRPCVEQLIKFMLGGGNSLTCGVGIVIEVIRKNNSDYDPEGVDPAAAPSSRDPIYLGSLLRLFAQHVPDFMNLIMNAPAQKERLDSTFGEKIEPLGFDRFKTCELMAELLHCSNMALLNEVGAEDFIAARDAQRHRLRAEGRLLPVSIREEVPSSVEDLTMRVSRLPTVDEGRKLEVMNISADDDGFEEVSPAADEETSHGVLELPDAPAPATSSLIDKDDEDFVDEPLSSPRLNLREIGGNPPTQQQPLEEADLVVAPLSPKKATAKTEGDTSKKDTAVEETTQGAARVPPQLEKPEPQHTQSEPGGDGPHKGEKADIPAPGQAVPEPELPEAGRDPIHPVEDKPPPSEELSPHPEDTPAPLFSGQTAAVASREEPERPAESDAMSSGVPPATAQGVEVSTQARESGSDAAQSEASGAQVADETGDASIVIAHIGETGDAPINPKPVVGDYLKMQFVEHRVVPTILSFFFKYPWNNFLHNVVYDIVQQVFNGPMDRGYNPMLAVSLFEKADITNQIINGQLASEKSQAEKKTRQGYMGHLTLIAEEVVKFTERHPPEILSEVVLEKVMAQDWSNYVDGALAETRERDNAILGGVRPEVAMSNRANASGLMGVGLSGLSSIGLGGGGGSSALADAGLNGGSDLAEGSASSGVGPFGLSSGTLMSGFGSSSDEDEDEEQESEEDVNNEFRAYTDPLNANSSNAANPPSIPPPPPPPPPLNIPPSRARLQLAARLAMNKRNAAAAAAANGGGGQEGSDASADDATGSGIFSLPSMTANERLRNNPNPFADYEDEDDDEEGSGSDDDVANVGGVGNDDMTMNLGGWNRGSWWRGVVRSARRKTSDDAHQETEKFGDGRDDDSEDSDGGGLRREEEDDIDDEEFGDFAMPEVAAAPGSEGRGGGLVSGIDPAREKILVKPLAVHPPTSTLKSSVSPFSSLWPFSSPGFGGSKEKKEEAGGETGAGDEAGAGSAAVITEEPVELTSEEEAMLSEDGKKINRAVEAMRRTSIEDPDEDEPGVGGEEIIVHKAAGVH